MGNAKNVPPRRQSSAFVEQKSERRLAVGKGKRRRRVAMRIRPGEAGMDASEYVTDHTIAVNTPVKR